MVKRLSYIFFTKQIVGNNHDTNNNTERNQHDSVLKSPATILTPTKTRNMSVDMKATIFVFPHTTLTKIIGKPKHENVTILRKEMYANAMQNDCTLGGGDNGYLGIIMPAVAYADKQTKEGNNNPIAFVKPQPPDPTAAASIIYSTNSSILDFKSMEGQLKGQIMDAIERKYIAELDDEQYGFANITAKTLLAYIVTKYDVITHHDLTKNRDI